VGTTDFLAKKVRERYQGIHRGMATAQTLNALRQFSAEPLFNGSPAKSRFDKNQNPGKFWDHSIGAKAMGGQKIMNKVGLF
jgi:hypothetical protein